MLETRRRPTEISVDSLAEGLFRVRVRVSVPLFSSHSHTGCCDQEGRMATFTNVSRQPAAICHDKHQASFHPLLPPPALAPFHPATAAAAAAAATATTNLG